MEIRFQRIFLIPTISMFAALMSPFVSADQEVNEFPATKQDVQQSVPANVERRQVLDDVLDTEDFEVGVQAGIISNEDFESSTWLAGHIAYHITDRFYLKARYGQADAGTSSFEKLSNTAPLLTDEQRELTYYGLNLGYNLLPGEIFLGKDLAFNSVFSVEVGGGSTEFAGDDNFTVNIATNFRIFINDWIAWDIGMTDYIFDTKITGEAKTTHNLSLTTGVSFYF